MFVCFYCKQPQFQENSQISRLNCQIVSKMCQIDTHQKWLPVPTLYFFITTWLSEFLILLILMCNYCRWLKMILIIFINIITSAFTLQKMITSEFNIEGLPLPLFLVRDCLKNSSYSVVFFSLYILLSTI